MSSRFDLSAVAGGQEYMVNVRGWVMLKGVDPGDYRIKIVDRGYWYGLCVNFYRPKGKTVLVCHTLENCWLQDESCTNLNAIIVKERVV